MKKRILLNIGTTSAFLWINLASCTYFDIKNHSKNNQNEQMDSVHFVFSIGRIEPELRIISVFSEEMGVLIKQNIPNGEWRNKGEVIAELDTEIQQQNVQKAKAVVNQQDKNIKLALVNVEKAKLLSDKSRQTLERARFAFRNQQINKNEVENFELAYKQSLLDVKKQEIEVEKQKNIQDEYLAKLRLEQAKLNKRKIKAPFDGKLLSLNIPIGTVVTPNQKLGDFAPEAPPFIFSNILAKDADKVLDGQKCIIRDLDTKDTLAFAKIIQSDLHYKLIDSTKKTVRSIKIGIESNQNTYFRLGKQVECIILID